MSKFANVNIVDSPTVSNTQWRAQQALEQVYPVRKSFSAHPAQIPLTPGTPIHKFDEAVGVNLPTQATAAVPSKPTPIHHRHGVAFYGSAACAGALFAGVTLALADFFIKRYFARRRKPVCTNCSCQPSALPVVDITTPYPWEEQ